jgi:ABC-type glycerol-3-phosphate transport system permease component
MTTQNAVQSATQIARPAPLRRSVISTVLLTGMALILAILFIWPFLSVLAWTFNDVSTSMNALLPIPAKFTTKVYELMVTRYKFQDYMVNSIWTSALITFLSTMASALAGYALAKFKFAGRDVLFGIILGVMLLPMGTMLVPQFVVMRDLKLVNNYWGLILPTVGGGAFNIFLMRQFMLSMPTEMLEASRMDGADEFRTFFSVVLPNTQAAVGVVATLVLRGAWNSLLWPQIIISDNAKQLIMPAIARVSQMGVADPMASYITPAAAITAALIPLALYSYSQRYFVNTLAGAIKG